MNVVIKEESEHDKHRYNIKLNQFKLKQKVCRTSFNLLSLTPKRLFKN